MLETGATRGGIHRRKNPGTEPIELVPRQANEHTGQKEEDLRKREKSKSSA